MITMGLCRTCIHFIKRAHGAHGGLFGICHLSEVDRDRYFKNGERRRVGTRLKCSNYKEETKDEDIYD